jgi:hypothetical protein
MDPNQALTDAREAAKVADEAAEGDSNDAEIDALRDALESYRALDEWLTRGGFLPTDWRDSRRRPIVPPLAASSPTGIDGRY